MPVAQLPLIQVSGVAFLSVLVLTPYIMRRLIDKNYLVPDYYKKGKPVKPTYGGITVLVGILASIIVAQFFLESAQMVQMLMVYFIIFNFAIFGLVDDLLDIERPSKFFIPFIIALPIALLNIDPVINFGPITFKLNFIYPFIISPIYVSVVANLINMHSGFNGLSGGLSTSRLTAIILKSYTLYGETHLLAMMPIYGALFAFMIYNLHPTKLFMGNVGSMLIGSAIGTFVIAFNMEYFGVIILIPHIINFLLFAYWKAFNKPWVKYGSVNDDGTISVPNYLTLKWVAPYFRRMTEFQATLISYGYTILFCIIGFLVT